MPFHDVHVAAVACCQKQAMVQRDEHQDGARLGVGREVGQRVRLAEPLVPCHAHASGHVHLPLDDVEPHASRRIEVGVDSGEDTDIGERHHQGSAVDRVPDRLALLEDGRIGLIVPASIDRVGPAANVEIVPGQVEVLSVARGAIELDAVDGVPLAA
jgi:hypothetical protein